MSNEKNDASLIWILAIFFGWISSLIFYLTKKEDAFLHSQSKLALNLSLNFLVVMIILSIIMSFLPAAIAGILSLLSLALWVGWIFICIKQMQKAKETNGEAQLALAIPMVTLIK